jgi:cytosine/adenosine deaminase-related metal-dependent hydrolase
MGSGARTDTADHGGALSGTANDSGSGTGSDITVLEGAHVVTVDGSGSEFAGGHVVVTGNRITAVGPGAAPATPAGARRIDARRIDARGCLITPGLVNTHHHLYQWITRGLAVDATLFGWLTTLYPIWGRIDADLVHTAASGGSTWLAKTGCTTTTDHHYVFPHDGGDVLHAEIAAGQRVGLRFHPTRGSMDLGQSKGGLPPDSVVEDIDAILAATEAAVDTYHDTSADAMLRIGVAPCSPFSVTGDLLKQTADLARRKGVRMHTHLCETVDEEEFCRERFGCSPVEYVESLGWLGDDVWLAHAVHLSDASITALAATGTSVAHCPTSNARLGAGICRSRDLRDVGVAVGLGVDGAASNEACSLLEEVRHSLLFARARGGPEALTVRDALDMATMGGARVLGRADEIGSLEVGKLADLAVWRLDTLAHIDIADPVAALVLGAPPPLELLMVNGRTIVEQDRPVTIDEDVLAREVSRASRTLLARAGAH